MTGITDPTDMANVANMAMLAGRSDTVSLVVGDIYDFEGLSLHSPSNLRNSRIQAGLAGQAGAVTRWPSTQTLSSPAEGSSQTAPALTNSGCKLG
jgi:hypothetical protein